MRKNGFTYIEFMISIMIMFLIAASVIPILFKKNKKTEPVRKVSKQKVYHCDETYTGDIIFQPTNPDGSVLYDPERNEFFTIKLIGGGASSSPEHKAGSAGEVKEITLPSMPGKYKIILGRAGTGNSSNGGITSISRQNSNTGSWQIIEYARGGVSSTETAEDDNDAMYQQARINDSEDRQCGRSGGVNEHRSKIKAKSGEVIIEWR